MKEMASVKNTIFSGLVITDKQASLNEEIDYIWTYIWVFRKILGWSV